MYEFRDFPKNGHTDKKYFRSKFEKFLYFPLKNDNLGLKMKILKFLGIHPIYKHD